MTEQGLVIDSFIPLTPDECKERDRLVNVMNDHEESAVAYIKALKEYRDKRLYRDSHSTFESFLAARQKARFKSRQRASQLVGYLEVVIDLAGQPGVDILPENERQTRPLMALSDPTERADAWLAAQAASGEEQPSGGWVKSGVETLQQIKDTDRVDTGDGKEAVPSVGNVMESVGSAQMDRIRRMQDHIRANRKAKPLAVFEGTVRSTFYDHLIEVNCIHVGGLPKDVFDKLAVGQQCRFVLYAIPVEPKKEQSET